MKKWGCFFALFCTFTLFAKELSYQISPTELEGRPALKILCEFEGSTNGMIDLVFPCVQDRLYLEMLPNNYVIQDTDHPDVKRIRHSPGEKLQVEYIVASEEMSCLPYQDRPIIRAESFLFFGYNLFVYVDGDYFEEAHIQLKWKDFPKQWSLANSYGIDVPLQEIDQPMWLFLNGIFGGGKVSITPCLDPLAPGFVAVFGEFSFSKERLVHTIEKIIRTQREFWSDYDFPYTFVAIHPNGEENSFAGQGTPNGFAIFTKNFSDESEKDWKDLAFVLSHEYFHTWNSVKMVLVPRDQSMAWFVEGFTDYYAAKLLLRAGLIDEGEFFGFIEETFEQYLSSPMKNEPNERIKEDFWNDNALQKLPYYRGSLLAFHWDSMLNKEGASLDDMMQRLFQLAKLQNLQFSIEDIIELVELPSAKEDIERYILSGESLDFTQAP